MFSDEGKLRVRKGRAFGWVFVWQAGLEHLDVGGWSWAPDYEFKSQQGVKNGGSEEIHLHTFIFI